MEIKNGTYCVYVHINKTNGKIYVGQTCQKIKERWKNGKGYDNCSYFYRAIQKYGWDGFEHEIVASNLTQKEANNFEVLLINMLNTMNPRFGYNLKSGGNANGFLSEETKAKIGKGNRGKKRTEEQRKVLSNARRGTKRSDESKRKTSISLMSKRIKQYKDMVVAQYSKTGELLNIYDTVAIASKQSGANFSAIHNCLAGKSKSSGGYIWRYVINDAIPNKIDHYVRKSKKCSGNQKGRSSTSVCQYNQSGCLVKEWTSMTEAAKSSNIGVNNIWKCCNNLEGRKLAGGFMWAYKSNVLTTQND